MVSVLAAQTAFDPIEHILTSEKHSFLGNWRPCDIRIDNFVHNDLSDQVGDEDAVLHFDILIAQRQVRLSLISISPKRSSIDGDFELSHLSAGLLSYARETVWNSL
jgi:hypothetical protein